MFSSISKLLGEKPESEISTQIVSTVNQIAGYDIAPHHFHCHSYGDHKEISFHIILNPELTIKEAHDLTDKMEDHLRTEYGLEATIHVDPKI